MLLRGAGVGLFLLINGCAVAPDLAQLRGEVVIARYVLDIDGLDSGFPQRGGGLIPDAAEAYDVARQVGQAIDTLRRPEQSVYRQTADAVLAQITGTLATATALRFAPVDRLRDQAPYLLGYPLGQGAALARAGAAPLLAEIEVDVSVPDQGTAHLAWLGSGYARTSGHPEMILRIAVYGRGGEVLWREQVIQRSSERVTLDERWLLGVAVERSVSDAASLPALAQRATQMLLASSRGASKHPPLTRSGQSMPADG